MWLKSRFFRGFWPRRGDNMIPIKEKFCVVPYYTLSQAKFGLIGEVGCTGAPKMLKLLLVVPLMFNV